jgi:hypothetical protein
LVTKYIKYGLLAINVIAKEKEEGHYLKEMWNYHEFVTA